MDWIDYDQHARHCARDDLWGQVRRTVRGQPVGDEQIDMIVAAVRTALELGPQDVLLDLACGNGALTARLRDCCSGSLGVDISPYLIEIARERFESADNQFLVADAASFAEAEASPERFTKALCYGSLSYFTDDAVARLLHALHGRFCHINRVLLGNLPDPARASAFFRDLPSTLREPRSDIGAWRSIEDLAKLAGPRWSLSHRVMPPGFFAAHYRFEIILERVA